MKYTSQEGRWEEGFFFDFSFKGEPSTDAKKVLTHPEIRSRSSLPSRRRAKLETNSNHPNTKLKPGRKGGWRTLRRLRSEQRIARYYFLKFSFSRASIFSSRFLCLPAEKGVSSQTLTISLANSLPTIRPPMIKTFASLCCRLQREE